MFQTLYPPNGTADDLLSTLARAEERRYLRDRVVLPRKTALGRRTVEPLLGATAIAAARLMEILPHGVSYSLQDRLLKTVAAGSVLPFDPGSPGIEEARRVCAELAERTGKRPALLALLSHPPVTPEWLNLNVEMSRQAVLALRLARGGPCRPRMVVAVDAYALDMLPLAQEAVYAGFMGSCHLGFDRLGHGRNPLGRFFFRSFSWERLPWRMSEVLSRGGEVSLVLAGGIPTTARVLYTSKEFLMRLRRLRRDGMPPSEAFARLEAVRPDFARLRKAGIAGPGLRRSAWRMMEVWLAAVLVGEFPPDDGSKMAALDAGRMRPEACEALAASASALGVPEPRFREVFAALEDEFARETPYRERFFRFLAGRVAARGIPVLLLPLSHRMETRPDGSRTVRLEWGRPVRLPTDNIAEFAEEFVRSHYP